MTELEELGSSAIDQYSESPDDSRFSVLRFWRDIFDNWLHGMDGVEDPRRNSVTF